MRNARSHTNVKQLERDREKLESRRTNYNVLPLSPSDLSTLVARAFEAKSTGLGAGCV
jgi:hypothetical protein